MVKLPDRWADYSLIGSQIPGTRLIAFKVPLREQSVASLPLRSRLTIPILLEKIPELGLVIDLTMTEKYYNKNDILDRGVCYAKIACPGQQLPAHHLVARFYSAVDSYFEEHRNDSTLIGVHCTHGVNRTGYFLARYLIERLGHDSQEAIDLVGSSRGHPIERAPYTRSLLRCLPLRSYHFDKSNDILLPSDKSDKMLNKPSGSRSPPLSWRTNKPRESRSPLNWRTKKADTSGPGKDISKFDRAKVLERSNEVKGKDWVNKRDKPTTSKYKLDRRQERWTPDSFRHGVKRPNDDSRMYYGRDFKQPKMEFDRDEMAKRQDNLPYKMNDTFESPAVLPPMNYEPEAFTAFNDPPSRAPFRESLPEPHTSRYGRPSGNIFQEERHPPHVARERSLPQPSMNYREPDMIHKKMDIERPGYEEPRSRYEGPEERFQDRKWWPNSEPSTSEPFDRHYENQHKDPQNVRHDRYDTNREREPNWNRKFDRSFDNPKRQFSPERIGPPPPDRYWSKDVKDPPREIRDYGREERYIHEEPRERRKFERNFNEADGRFPTRDDDERRNFEQNRPFVENPPFDNTRYNKLPFDDRHKEHQSRSRKEERDFGYAHRYEEKHKDFITPRRKDEIPVEPSRYDTRAVKEDHIIGPIHSDRIYSPDRRNMKQNNYVEKPIDKYAFRESPREFNRPSQFHKDHRERTPPFVQREQPLYAPRIVQERHEREFYDRNHYERDFEPSHPEREHFPLIDNRYPVGGRSPNEEEFERGHSSRIIRERPRSPEDLREEIRLRRGSPPIIVENDHFNHRRRGPSRSPPRHLPVFPDDNIDCRALLNQKRGSSNFEEPVETPDRRWESKPPWADRREVVEKTSNYKPKGVRIRKKPRRGGRKYDVLDKKHPR